MGEWVTENIFNLITLAMIGVGGVAAFTRLQGSVTHLAEKVGEIDSDVKEMDKKISDHTSDEDKHVNHLYMRVLSEDIKSIKEKLDILNEKIHSI